MASNVENYLNSLGKYVVKQSRTMLTKAKKNVNKDLYNSIKYKVVPDGDGFTNSNSPLISDSVYDIAFDGENGKVYLATEITRSFYNATLIGVIEPILYLD